MLYPKFNSFLEVIFAERLWQCSGRPGMINTYSNYTLGVDNQKCTTYNWHRTIKVVYNQIFSSIIVSYWIWFFHYSNSEMFGQRMIILVQLESVQRMSSCVCLISSKWIFPPVREKTGVILTHNQTACLRLLINEMVSQSANFSLFHWVRESVFSYLGVISTVLVFNHPCQWCVNQFEALTFSLPPPLPPVQLPGPLDFWRLFFTNSPSSNASPTFLSKALTL